MTTTIKSAIYQCPCTRAFVHHTSKVKLPLKLECPSCGGLGTLTDLPLVKGLEMSTTPSSFANQVLGKGRKLIKQVYRANPAVPSDGGRQRGL